MKNIKLPPLLSNPAIGTIAFLGLAALSGCGFVRVLLLEPFDEVELEPQPFDMAAKDNPDELVRTTLLESQFDIGLLIKQGNNEKFRESITRFNNFDAHMAQVLQHSQSGLLHRLSPPDQLRGSEFSSQLAEYVRTPDQYTIKPKAALLATLPVPGLQRMAGETFTVSQSDLNLRVLNYPLIDVSQTFFSSVHGPDTNAPNCRDVSCAKASDFLSTRGFTPAETMASNVAPFKVTLQNFFVRSVQGLMSIGTLRGNTYQAAVQCARAEVVINGQSSTHTWPRIASLVVMWPRPPENELLDSIRYTMVANTLLATAANTIAASPAEFVEVVLRPESSTGLSSNQSMRVKGFQFLFDGARSGQRFEYHQYLVPFFSRFWATTQTPQTGTSFFSSSIPKGRILVLENSGNRTDHGVYLMPSSAQVGWLADNWKIEGEPFAGMPSDQWSTLKPFQIFDRNGEPGELVSHPDFNTGGALDVKPSATDGPQSIDKFLLTLPTDVWKAAPMNTEGETYQVKEFFDSLGASCAQAMTAN